MAKNIRWQIPFVSLQGIHYRVDIYDEGTFTPVQLTAGPTPFVTDEDASDDFFYPVRTQTGTLQVCTLLPGTTDQYITLDDLLPANNIARPVRLLNLDNSNAIEWQGFLSCEAYSQDYTGIPQVLDLPLISVLEAMDSVQLEPSRSSGLKHIREALYYILDEIRQQCDTNMTFFTHVNFSQTDWHIYPCYIDQTIMFAEKEYNNENSTIYITDGLSAKEALSRICKYMGSVAREQGTEIYIQRIGESIGFARKTLSAFKNSSNPSGSEESITTQAIATAFADKWMGTGHQRSIAAGAKSVGVTAKLEKYEFKMELPESPLGDTTDYSTEFRQSTTSSSFKITFDSLCNRKKDFSTNCTFKTYKVTDTARIGAAGTPDNIIETSLLNPNSEVEPTLYQGSGEVSAYKAYVGTFMARIKRMGGYDDDYRSGIYMVGIENRFNLNTPSETNHLFEIRSILEHTLEKGTLKITGGSMSFYGSNDYGRGGGLPLDKIFRAKMSLSIGGKYWNGTNWVDSFAAFDVQTATDPNEYTIPIDSRITGEVKLRIYCDTYNSGLTGYYYTDVFFYDLALDYEMDDQGGVLNDRSENNYFRLLGTNFRDEISVNVDMASSLNNKPSPSLLFTAADNTVPITTIQYLKTASTTEYRRPEVDLLNRLAAYYGVARQRLELEVAHPTAAPLPLLKLNGINDGKVYLPLSESRDWQTDVCKLTCFETPT